MIPFASILAAAPDIMAKWWKLGVGMLLGAILIAPLAHCTGKREGRRATVAEYEAAATRITAANEKLARAADRLRRDTLERADRAITSQRKEIDDATRNIPDAAPSARQRAIACASLRSEARRRGAPEPAC